MSENSGWYYADAGKPVGPMLFDELVAALGRRNGMETMVYGPGMGAWAVAKSVDKVAARLRGASAAAAASRPAGVPPPPISYQGARPTSDVIDYKIFGEEMQYAEVTLDPGEMVVAEAGAMMYMSMGIKMETVFGDPSAQQTGFLGKLASAGKRLVTGESLFMTTFTATGRARESIAFAAPYPGKIIAMHLDELGGEMICQKDSFLCAARGVQIGIAFQKKIGVGLFGGEGFIM